MNVEDVTKQPRKPLSQQSEAGGHPFLPMGRHAIPTGHQIDFMGHQVVLVDHRVVTEGENHQPKNHRSRLRHQWRRFVPAYT